MWWKRHPSAGRSDLGDCGAAGGAGIHPLGEVRNPSTTTCRCTTSAAFRFDVIDFDYPPWHTQGDTPDRCSAASLAKVGWVIREWLKEEGRRMKDAG